MANWTDLAIVRAQSVLSIPLSISDEEHVLLVMLFDLLDEHLEEVGCAHARPLAHLPVQGEGQLGRFLVYREN